MADRTLTINHADGGSETYTLKTEDVLGVRSMSVDGETVTIDRTAPDLVRTIIADGQTITIDTTREGVRTLTVDGTEITIDRTEESNLESFIEQFSGASLILSLKDRASTTGNTTVVRVRRSSDNAEADFKAKEVSDGTLVDWVGAGNDGFVPTWYNQSGNGNDATQSVYESQPKIVDAGVLVSGGLDFDGVDDTMIVSDPLTNSSGTTAFLVANIPDGQGESTFLRHGNSNPNNAWIFQIGSDSGNPLAIIRCSSGTISSGSTEKYVTGGGLGDAFDKRSLYVANMSDGVGREIVVNENSRILTQKYGSNQSSTFDSASSMSVGSKGDGSSCITGVFSEIIIYDFDNSTNRTVISENMNGYYGFLNEAKLADFSLTTTPTQKSDHVETSVGASWIVQTDASSVTANATTSYTASNVASAKIGYRINGGSWSNFGPSTSPSSFSSVISLPSGTNNIEFINGSKSRPSSNILGTFIQSAVPSDDVSVFKVLSGANLANQCVVYGDSITAGGNATNRPYEGYPILLRELVSNPVTVEAYGWRALNDDCSTSGDIDSFVSKIAAVSPSIVWLAIGTNDYGLSRQSASSFESQYEELLTDLTTALPSAKIYCASPIHRTDESANSFGNTTGDYRTAISNAVTTIADANVTYVDTSSWLGDSDLEDGVHPTTAGHAIMAAELASTINS